VETLPFIVVHFYLWPKFEPIGQANIAPNNNKSIHFGMATFARLAYCVNWPIVGCPAA
jgi:hypothetical protein